MKQFKDLEFGPHAMAEGLQAKMFFENGFGISVVRFKDGFGGGYGSFTSNESEWEIAVLKGNDNDWDLTYDTPITDDVIGHCSEVKVNEIMENIQKLDKKVG